MRRIATALFAGMALACGGDTAEEQPERPQPSAASVRAAAARDSAAQDTMGPAAAGTGSSVPAESVGAPAPPDAGPEPEGDGRDLHTIQVAAFVDGGRADEWVARLRTEGWPVWSSVAEVGGRTFHRVRIGTTETEDAARRLGELVTEQYGWPVWVAPVTPADPFPPNAVQATRRALERAGS